MRKRPYMEIVVEGTGAFPFDMLRYDACFPMDSEDAAAMELHRCERRRVKLYSVSQDPPARDRWNSFMWRVIEYRRPSG